MSACSLLTAATVGPTFTTGVNLLRLQAAALAWASRRRRRSRRLRRVQRVGVLATVGEDDLPALVVDDHPFRTVCSWPSWVGCMTRRKGRHHGLTEATSYLREAPRK